MYWNSSSWNTFYQELKNIKNTETKVTISSLLNPSDNFPFSSYKNLTPCMWPAGNSSSNLLCFVFTILFHWERLFFQFLWGFSFPPSKVFEMFFCAWNMCLPPPCMHSTNLTPTPSLFSLNVTCLKKDFFELPIKTVPFPGYSLA